MGQAFGTVTPSHPDAMLGNSRANSPPDKETQIHSTREQGNYFTDGVQNSATSKDLLLDPFKVKG